tara:strand:+ start:2244 stop:2414 length:171 start_codon:yes stop_codon:yes gene_type:complete
MANGGTLYYCETCEKPWETYWDNNLNRFVKYKNIPSLYLERVECGGCVSGKIYEMA